VRAIIIDMLFSPLIPVVFACNRFELTREQQFWTDKEILSGMNSGKVNANCDYQVFEFPYTAARNMTALRADFEKVLSSLKASTVISFGTQILKHSSANYDNVHTLAKTLEEIKDSTQLRFPINLRFDVFEPHPIEALGLSVQVNSAFAAARHRFGLDSIMIEIRIAGIISELSTHLIMEFADSVTIIRPPSTLRVSQAESLQYFLRRKCPLCLGFGFPEKPGYKATKIAIENLAKCTNGLC
jgi:hypothetical protein